MKEKTIKKAKEIELQEPDDNFQAYRRRAKRLVARGSLPRFVKRYLTQEFPGTSNAPRKQEVSHA